MTRVALALWLAACGADPIARVQAPDGEPRLRVHVQVARTAAERRQGLRGRASLGDDEGLWIAFPVEGEVCLVNDGVPFGVDALFVDAASTVTAVASLAPDQATPVCGLARDVLELAAGRAASVEVGDRAVLDP